MIAAMLAAAAVQAAPLPAGPATVQQAFDRATALNDEGKWAEALAAWEALERLVKNRRTLAIVRVRKSAVLFRLDRGDDAVAAARAGLADLPASDATLREDRFQALANLANVAKLSLDYAGALQLFAEAEGAADTPGTKLGALLQEATTGIFVDPAKAAAALDRADAIIAANTTDAQVRAEFLRQRGLLLLNRGDFAVASRTLASAIKLLGGMTLKIDQSDVRTRSDAAIAALLSGNSEEARRYMAYTGAGRLGDGVTFAPGTGITPPDCGGEAGLKPEDVAVVEFTIAEDGSVAYSAPVYAAGGGKVALEFARAARGWSWTPEEVKALPAFYRYNVRLEMRCSTGFERPPLRDTLAGDLVEWLRGKGVAMTTAADTGAAAALAGQRAALAAAEAKDGGTSLAALAALYPLMTSPIVGREETYALGTRAAAIATANQAPPLARLAIDLVTVKASTTEKRGPNALLARYAALLGRPDYAADPQARAAIRLVSADEEKPGSQRSTVLLRQVADDAALTAKDPLKVGALVRIASAEQGAGRPAEARAAFERSGLSGAQCALVDTPPKMVKVGGTFPQEAQAWGFEGWTQVQQDIAADGTPVNTRVVASYPPFVFSKAGGSTMASARFAKTFRPDGGLGCGGQTSRVRFKMTR